jgi:hypothetical protein
VAHPSTQSIFLQTSLQSPLLNVRYDNLVIIGKQIIRLIDIESRTLDDVAKQKISTVFDLDKGVGYPKVFINGAFNTAFYAGGYAQFWPMAPAWGIRQLGQLGQLDQLDQLDQLELQFKEMDWCVQYFSVIADATTDRSVKDFSSYTHLRIEARTDTPGKTVFIVIKDGDDPDDGSESRVPLKLTEQWQIYDIPLSDFVTADLTQLNMVVGFLFLEEAQTINVRTVEYIR